ncbi:hypothetical protein [Nocardiopsis kunsanensis]|uniref:Uncharacterized protein n=1 Tax=Nocardiopsis kunsanensis TaxID=141693 RepID=A0A918X5W3_9ACTN|nr:hypothetical protein [Nocardiopsis kunsanensis]GHD14600.1 hypothetical protein GCM10007147_00800 [Nocardiopsis kunsanensis]
MTSPHHNEDEFEAQLRQLLKAEADSVQPSAEGLDLIRERTEKGRAAAWFGLPWLRPALAVAGAALIATSVIMSSPQVRDQVLDIVPAGADRDGTPPLGSDGTDNDGGAAAPDTSTSTDDGTTQPESDPPGTPAPEPSPEQSPTASEEEDYETAASCPPEDGPSSEPTRSPDGDRPDTGESGQDCEPSGEPSEPEETDEPAPDDGDEDGTEDGESGQEDPGAPETEAPDSTS